MAVGASVAGPGLGAVQHLQRADVLPLPPHVPGAHVCLRNPPSIQDLHQGTSHLNFIAYFTPKSQTNNNNRQLKMKGSFSLFWGVLKSYVGYLLIYGLFLICFAVGYLQMFAKAEKKDEMEWPSEFWLLVMHVFNMFLGTLELANIQWAEARDERYTQTVQLIYVFLFAVLIMLTLLNLLNALAIEDVNRMIEKSETDRLYTILCLVVFWEQRFSKVPSPSRLLNNQSADTSIADCFKVLPEKEDKKLYFKAFQNKEAKFSLMNVVTYGFSNSKTFEGYISPSEKNPSDFRIPKILADQAIEIVHEKTSQESRLKEKNDRNLFYEKVLSNTANMEKVIKTSLEDRIAKIEDNISTILNLLQKK